MRILYIIQNDVSQDTGDIRHIFEVVENLCNLGHRLFVLVPRVGKYNYETKARIIYIPVIKKLGFSEDKFEEIMESSIKSHYDYSSDEALCNAMYKIKRLLEIIKFKRD